MTLDELTRQFLSPARRKALTSGLKSKRLCLTQLAGSATAFALLGISEQKKEKAGNGQPLLVVADNADDAGYLYHDLSRMVGEDATLMFPSGYRRSIRFGQADEPSRILRTEVLNRWYSGAVKFVISYPEALAEQVATRQSIDEHTLTLLKGVVTDLNDTVKWLRDNNFTQVDYVYEPGQFALRGSILDIFGYSSELPLRVDFFGDEIDSIRTFDTQTQLSEQKLDIVAITSGIPAKETVKESLLDFISRDTLIALHDPEYVCRRIEDIANESFSESASLSGEAETDAMSHVVKPEEFKEKLSRFNHVVFTAAAQTTNKSEAVATMDFHTSPQAIYHKNFDIIADSFNNFLGEGYNIYILSDSEGQFIRLKAIFEDRKDNIHFTPVLAMLHEGFIDHALKICVFTDHQIFDRFHRYTLRSDRARQGKVALSLKELSAIEPGDFIVHADHGVGKFAGLLRTNVNGHTQEMIKLLYANDDIIFVSIHALHKLSKYRGKEGVPPKINRVGSGAWNKIKEKTKSRLKDIARDLILLYSQRKQQKGFAFSPDSYLQHELEASFIYEDTPDQLTATQSVKSDMESEKPMDRLVCGDVGFGKTEVAIRAAFKAAVDGKQTAVLVPTTVLAHQHFQTFSERLKDFPVRVDYLSRARTTAQTRAIIKDLADGKIDILIGTHKIIGKEVKFKDLGLLVVDEEQKFGVAVKEKLKQMKTSVDTLTMSATPIPRTLQFSLMGARDLSSINTPPPNRHPIVTSVTSAEDEEFAEAINFELSRNGQVFVVNNRIEGLTELENRIHRLIPDARVVVAHGQMPPDKLEKAIVDFQHHDYDILLSTTIIESGVDMPRVNTIIVNNAQNFGLSELHQLRGRVGRSNRRAFCYLLVPSGAPLSDVARRRLQAIESFSELGSGIHIAMQDLDIRGAGNLLGAEQSGFIADLGYETYQRILKEAVTEVKGELPAEAGTSESAKEEEYVADTVIDTDMELLFPPDYVPGDSERITLYRELDSIDRELDLQDFKTRLADRFGPPPRVAMELMRVPRLRRLARQLGITKVVLKQNTMFIYFVDDSNRAYYQSPSFGRILSYLQNNQRRCHIRESGGKRSFSIDNVKSVEDAVSILDAIHTLPVA